VEKLLHAFIHDSNDTAEDQWIWITLFFLFLIIKLNKY